MFKLTTVLQSFFEDKVSFFLKGSPLPVYRTRQAVSKLGHSPESPSKVDRARLASSCSSVSSIGTSMNSEDPVPPLAANSYTMNLRSRSNHQYTLSEEEEEEEEEEEDVASDGEDGSVSGTAHSVSSGNEYVTPQRLTRSMYRTQFLPSVSSSEGTPCVEEAAYSTRLRTRSSGLGSGRK